MQLRNWPSPRRERRGSATSNASGLTGSVAVLAAGGASIPPPSGRGARSPSASTSSSHQTQSAQQALDELRERTGRPRATTQATATTPGEERASPDLRGTQSLGAGVGANAQTASAPPMVRSATPPPYAHHSLDRSPLPNPMVLDDRPRVPPPIYLRSSSIQPQSRLGTLTIHVPGWGVALVRPPRQYDLHPLEAGQPTREPPAEDTVLTGTLEVVMKERRRVQAISVGVQSVARLNMCGARGWEEDGIFERGVEILSGVDEEGIWLEKGSQSFSFSILLPATLATYDYHQFGRVSYIITARVEGIPATGGVFGNKFKSRELPIQGDIPFLADFQSVIARSDKIAADQAAGLSNRPRSGSNLSPRMGSLALGDSPTSPLSDEHVIAFGGTDSVSTPPVRGLYHRRPSGSDAQVPTLSSFGRPSPLRRDTDNISVNSNSDQTRSEKAGWLSGDICAMRKLKVHANPTVGAGVFQLDLRKEGFVEGLGPWRFSATSDAFSIASVMLVQLTIPKPAPTCTIFFVRLLLSQSYTVVSPRTPNDPPIRPEGPRNHVIYQVGRPHQHGESRLGHPVPSLWRGPEAGGVEGDHPPNGYRTRAVARLPNHDKIRPTTSAGTITPLRVSHELLVRIFYSMEGETVTGKQINGPGEVRMCQVRLPITVPSCCCSTAALNLPTYECANETSEADNNLDPRKQCQCGATFQELSSAAVRRRQAGEADPDEEWALHASNGGMGSEALERHEEARRTASERGKIREAHVPPSTASGSGGASGSA
ncbi:uncharacterized protein LOC62_03G004798 [Vanrija pseudolonga]|uniref:Arrestin-like N-terminal domain-containing protein n=1 Tax=Vanrija pseudolonga TaxID=143232 RepID=A0AAF1BLT6_9TREE|nr:hypothetical protein LOC62_03G004798 [Vanrija pseudolonga]